MNQEKHNVNLKVGTLFLATPIAAGISYAVNGGFWWAVLHGLLNWAYIAYWVVNTFVEGR